MISKDVPEGNRANKAACPVLIRGKISWGICFAIQKLPLPRKINISSRVNNLCRSIFPRTLVYVLVAASKRLLNCFSSQNLLKLLENCHANILDANIGTTVIATKIEAPTAKLIVRINSLNINDINPPISKKGNTVTRFVLVEATKADSTS